MTPAAWSVTAVFVAIELLIVGGLGALAAVRLGFPYAALTPVSLLVYGFAGYFAGRAGGSGAVAGGVVAFLDAAAWAAFGGVGPQPVPSDATIGGKLSTIAFVTVLGIALGFAGGWFAARGAAAGS
jgi:hypothetical protein